MVKRQFICKNCGQKFYAEVFEKGEAERKGIRSTPVRCPQCKSANIEKV